METMVSDMVVMDDEIRELFINPPAKKKEEKNGIWISEENAKNLCWRLRWFTEIYLEIAKYTKLDSEEIREFTEVQSSWLRLLEGK